MTALPVCLFVLVLARSLGSFAWLLVSGLVSTPSTPCAYSTGTPSQVPLAYLAESARTRRVVLAGADASRTHGGTRTGHSGVL